MKRTIAVVLVAGTLSLLGVSAAQAQNPNCSDNCGIGVGGGNPYMPPPGQASQLPPPAGKGNAQGQASVVQDVVGSMADAAGEALASPTTTLSAPTGAAAAEGVRVLLSDSGQAPAAVAQVQSALAGAGDVGAALRGGGGAFEGTATAPVMRTNRAQQVAAAKLVRALDGLLKPGQKPERVLARAHSAAHAFNDFVAVAEPGYLEAPPAEFLLVRETLERMLQTMR